MKFDTMILDPEKRTAGLVVKDVQSRLVGVGGHPSGTFVIVYETNEGRPGPEIATFLREMADTIDRGGGQVIKVGTVPLTPEAKA